ncbi:MAG TPA: hypothetical protein VGM54_15415 [Chthoniobacter sp.]|jgi:hypothetical protein
MVTSRVLVSNVGWFKTLVIAAALCSGLSGFARAEQLESLLPPFAGKGYDFKKESKDDHHISGWLPVKWCDNSKWAAVNATFTKLDDSPDKDQAAVRIEVKNVDDGQLQLTSFEGNSEYKKGATYLVTGWVRSERFTQLLVGAREEDDPHDFYKQIEVPTGARWSKFKLEWTPEMDCVAWIMFVIKAPGTVDVAGITVTEK